MILVLFDDKVQKQKFCCTVAFLLPAVGLALLWYKTAFLIAFNIYSIFYVIFISGI